MTEARCGRRFLKSPPPQDLEVGLDPDPGPDSGSGGGGDGGLGHDPKKRRGEKFKSGTESYVFIVKKKEEERNKKNQSCF